MSYYDHPFQYDLIRSSGYKEEVRFIDEVLCKHDFKSVVDVGCGTGEHVRLLAELGYKAVGIDSSSKMIGYAKQKKIAAAKFRKADMREYAIKSDSIICMYAAINYFKKENEILEAFENFYKNLNSPGVLIIDTRYSKNLIEAPKSAIIEHDNGKILFISEWKKKGHMSAVYITKLAEISQKPFIEIEEHELNFLDPFWLKKKLNKTGFNVNIFEGFSKKPYEANSKEPRATLLAYKQE